VAAEHGAHHVHQRIQTAQLVEVDLGRHRAVREALGPGQTLED